MSRGRLKNGILKFWALAILLCLAFYYFFWSIRWTYYFLYFLCYEKRRTWTGQEKSEGTKPSTGSDEYTTHSSGSHSKWLPTYCVLLVDSTVTILFIQTQDWFQLRTSLLNNFNFVLAMLFPFLTLVKVEKYASLNLSFTPFLLTKIGFI